jgi:biopolymer transport protein ExbD
LTSLLTIIVVSVLISRIIPIDFAAVNEKILDRNISKKYAFELPSSSREERVRNAYSITDIYVVIDSFSTIQINPKLLFQDSIIEFDELAESIVKKRNENDSWDVFQLTFKLNIDKRVQMVWVNQVIKTLTQQQYRKFWFSVLPMKMKYDPRYYNLNGIPLNFLSFSPPSPDLKTFNSQIDNFITIEQMANDSFKFNNENIRALIINDSLEKYLSTNSIIKFYVNDEATYNSFIFIVTAIRETVHKLRNDYSMNEYQKAFDDLERFERKAVKKKFREIIFVITDEMNQILNSEEDL